MSSNLTGTWIREWKTQTEAGYGRMGQSVASHPLLWLVATLVLTGALATQLLNLRQDTTIESFLNPDSLAIAQYNEFREEFGRDEVFIITVEVADVFGAGFIDTLQRFHEQLENEVPYVDSVSSLINARRSYGEDDTLINEELFADGLPADKDELQAVKEYTYNNPQYQSYLISKDRQLVSVMVKLLPFLTVEGDDGELQEINLADKHMSASAATIADIISQYEGVLSDDIRAAGSPSVGISLGESITKDFTNFTFLSVLIVGIILFIIFRRMSGVFMPIVVMIFGSAATLSTMALLDTPMQMTTAILPSFLMAVCVGDSIHLLSIFYQRYDAGESKAEAISSALKHTGVALFFTSVTTAAGLASFSTSDLYPIANLGIYGAVGAVYAFIYTIFVLPSLLMLFPVKHRQREVKQSTFVTVFINDCVRLSTRSPKIVAVCGISLFIGSVVLALQLNFTHDSMKWFPEDHPVRLAVLKTEERLGGTMPIEVVIDTGRDGGATDPELLKKLDQALTDISTWQTDQYKISKVIGLHDIVKETHRSLNDNDETYYVIPNDQALIRQELFLVEMDASDQLFQLTDPSYRLLRASIMIPWIDANNYGALIDRVESHIAESVGDVENIKITGMTVILAQTFSEMLFSTAKSYGLAAGVISLMMILLLGNLREGLVSMIPNLLPIVMVLAIMRLVGVPLDMFTLLIGSIAIGLTVDNTVHFMHGFKRSYAVHGDPALAAAETLHSTGRAMMVTTSVLALGFMIYTQAEMNNLRDFGWLTALCIVLALFSDFILAPALMMLMTRSQRDFSAIDEESPEGLWLDIHARNAIAHEAERELEEEMPVEAQSTNGTRR